MKTRLLLVTVLLITSGCTSINVKPIAATSLQQVCIVNNPKVIIDEFVPVLQDGFARHHIATQVVEQAQSQSCEVTLTYTALRSWDFAPYLSHAELRLWRAGRQIGAADYHLRGKGGFALNKWAGVRSKMDPVIDQLLGGQRGTGAAMQSPQLPVSIQSPQTAPQSAQPMQPATVLMETGAGTSPSAPAPAASGNWRNWGAPATPHQPKTLYRCPGDNGSEVVTETPAAGCTVIHN
ncbi:MAG: Sbal_3080 family lipoprotein [Stenotrophomonas sp.]